MNRNQILVRKISHLTDARYFAAMGVDWMSMELNSDPASFMRWHTLRGWVEGVKLAAELIVPDDMLIAKTIIDAQPEGIVFQEVGMSEGLPAMQLFFDVDKAGDVSIPEHSISILAYDGFEKHKIAALDPQITFFQAEWTTGKLDSLLQSGYTGGICFAGGEEDVTGVRDYELMDELLQILQD